MLSRERFAGNVQVKGSVADGVRQHDTPRSLSRSGGFVRIGLAVLQVIWVGLLHVSSCQHEERKWS